MSEAEAAGAAITTYDIGQILNALPHRYPLLLVDRVTRLEIGEEIRAVKAVTFNEQFFQGHFPGHPIMPGVLQLEAMAQVASIVLLRMPCHQGKIGYFLSANNVKWRKPVVPGDTLVIETEITKAKRTIPQAVGRCLVNGQVVSEAELMFNVVDR